MIKHEHRGFTLELDRDGDNTVYADISKGDFVGSLAMVEDLGTLDHYDDWSKTPMKVPQSTVEFFQKCEEEFLAMTD
tara:strand:- start:474 stop:704 length:231 start_codon:yes stop_codon:yes gene_type:complete